MPISYGKEAHDLCRKLYCQFGGNAVQIEIEMRKVYPSWRKQNLFDRADRLGWITKLNLERSLKLHQETQIQSIENDDERRYRAVVELADMYQSLALSGDEKAVSLFIKLTDQQIELRTRLDLSSSNFESFVEAFEAVSTWAGEIDIRLGKLFLKNSDKFIERAEAKYGKSADHTSN